MFSLKICQRSGNNDTCLIRILLSKILCMNGLAERQSHKYELLFLFKAPFKKFHSANSALQFSQTRFPSPFLPSWKSLLQFSHLSVLSPPLGCAAINNSQVPPSPPSCSSNRGEGCGCRGSMLECQGSGGLPPVGPLTSLSDTGPRKGIGAVRDQVLLDAGSCLGGCGPTATISCPASPLVGASRAPGSPRCLPC